MKVLVVTHDFGEGGVWTVTRNLCHGLQARGVECPMLLLSAREPLPSVRRSGIDLEYVCTPKGRLLSLLKRAVAIRRKIDACTPDIILTTEVHMAVAALLARPSLRRKMVFSEHTASAAVYWLLLKQAVKGRHIAYTIRCIINLVTALAYYQFYRLAGAVVMPSSENRELFIRYFLLPASKLHYIPNPLIDSGTTPALRPHDRKSGQPCIFIGCSRLVAHKGQDVLIRALALVRRQIDARLVLMGMGDSKPLQLLAKELGVDGYVEFTGHVDDVYERMARADVFVHASRIEIAPCTLVEALNVGLPIVATRCMTGPAEILEEGKYGILVPVDDVQAFAQGMLDAAEGRAPSTPQGRRERSDAFSMASSVNAYMRIFASCSQP